MPCLDSRFTAGASSRNLTRGLKTVSLEQMRGHFVNQPSRVVTGET
jgi:hypothetical protein